MIRVLKDWNEIDEATHFLRGQGLPLHMPVEKNWDLRQVDGLTHALDHGSGIVDLGCGEAHNLKLLHRRGFGRLHGVDHVLSRRVRIGRIQRFIFSGWRIPYRLSRGDLTRTGLAGAVWDVVLCTSVIEHGVNVDDFFKEASRLLKPGGLLFVTTDYWEDTIEIPETLRPFGCPWKILDRTAIRDLVKRAGDRDLELYRNQDIPRCVDRCVDWNDHRYTFISLCFRKLGQDTGHRSAGRT